MPSAAKPEPRRLSLNGDAKWILTLIGAAITAAIAWANLRGAVSSNATAIERVSAEQDVRGPKIYRDIAQNREAVAVLRATLLAIKETQRRIEGKLDQVLERRDR